MGKITGSIAINNFSNIKSNLDLVNRVFYVFKILARIISEEEKDEKIFLLLEKYLMTMDTGDIGEDKADVLTLGFLFQVLAEMGYRLEMEKCVHCEKKLLLENNYFSISRGGILCSNCQDIESKKMLISNEAIKLIRIFLQNKLENLTKLKVHQIDMNRLKIILNESINWFSGENFRV